MNIVVQLLKEYFKQENILTGGLIILSLIVSLIQANGISYINASIIEAVENGNKKAANIFFTKFVVLSAIFVLVYYTYKSLQTKLLTKLRQWIKYKLIGLLLKTNNENMNNINYSKISTPINRISSVCFMLFTDLFSGMLPSLSFAVIICVYLFMNDTKLGSIFLLGNAMIFMWLFMNMTTMFDKNVEYEKYTSENENYLLEILNNIDKIIFRGQVDEEVNIFKSKTKEAIEKAINFYFNVEHNGLLLNIIISALVSVCIWYAIKQVFSKKMSTMFFVSFMTMILLYRDKMISFAQMVPDFVEFIGRTNTVLKHFNNINMDVSNAKKVYNPINLPFHKIEYQTVSFKYKENEEPLFQNLNLVLDTSSQKIYGITGVSGKGKSTVMKMLLKLHSPSHGKILIDDVDIENVDPDYIRKNITYVNQTGKLFDRKIIENIMYGCNHSQVCTADLKEIMERPKIQELFKDIDIFNKRSGALGENLSGGQRQVVNIIGGLINPSKILILDEPTNALDAALKKDIISLIKEYSKRKQAIIIITHDKDMYSILDEKIEL